MQDISRNVQFARAWLSKNNIEIFMGKKQILKSKFNTRYTFKEYMEPLQYTWEIGKDFIDSTEDSRVITADELKQKGWVVVFNQESEKYFLKRGVQLTSEEYEPLPSELNRIQIEYKEAMNEIRIKEREGKTWPWFKLERGPYDTEKITRALSYNDAYRIAFGKGKRERELRFKIRDGYIPALKTRDNLLICIPVKEVDPVRIVIIGIAGHGKSKLENYFCFSIFYVDWKNSNFLFFNDCLDQFHSMMLPANYWLDELKEFGIEPRPLPTINLYLARPDVIMRHTKVSFRYVVDAKYFYERFFYFSERIDDWKMNPQYLQHVISHLTTEKPDREKIKDLLFEKMGFIDSKGNRRGVPLGMINKFISGATNVYNAGFLNICYDMDGEVMPSKWRMQEKEVIEIVKEVEDRPLIVAMESHLIPVLNTSDVIDEPWFKNLIADEMRYLQEYQKNKSKKRLYLFIDELTTIYQTGRGGSRDRAAFELHRLFRQGRFMDIGFIINLQSYHSLDQDIQDNLNYLFVGAIQNAEDLNDIKRNYGVSKEQILQLDTLKKFEFALFTKSPVLAYNKYGKTKDVSKVKMFIGLTIPPACRHLPASKKLK